MLATLLIAAVVVTIPILHGSHLQKAHASGTAAITLGSTVLTANTIVKITGTGFNPDDTVSFYIDNTNNTSPNVLGVNSTGSISGKIWLPTGIPQGKHIFFAKDSVNIVQVPVTFRPRITGTTGKPGLAAQFSGASFAANETVSIYLGTDSTGTSEGTATANATGDLTFSFTVPTNLTYGLYPVTAIRTNQKPAKVATTFKIIPIKMISTPGIRIDQKGISVQLSGFLPNESVDISWSANGGQSIGNVYTDSKGATSKNAIVYPPSAPFGTYTLTASDSSGLTVTNPISVGPGISFWGNSMVPNQTLYVNGGGFTTGETVQVYFDSPKNGVVTATPDATGAFNVTITIPATYDPTQKHYVYAKSTSNSEQGREEFIPEQPRVFVGSDIYYNASTWTAGQGFGSGETVDVIWGYQQSIQQTVGTVVADPDGNVYFNMDAEPSFPVRNLTIAFVGRTSHFAPTITVSNNPTLLISPTTGDVGTTISISGGNLGANDTITLTEGTVTTSITSQSDGSFSTTYTAPADPGRGDLPITATDATANVTASTTFYYQPTVTLSPTTVHSGDTITITGQHFAANESIDIYEGSDFPSQWTTTDASGSFTISFVVTTTNFGYGTDAIAVGDNTFMIFANFTFLQ